MAWHMAIPAAAEFALAQVVTPGVVVVILDLPLLQCKVTDVTLMSEVMAIRMATAASVWAGVGHLVAEETMVTGYMAPTQGQYGTEVMGRLAVGGKVVVQWAIGAAFPLLEFFLG